MVRQYGDFFLRTIPMLSINAPTICQLSMNKLDFTADSLDDEEDPK